MANARVLWVQQHDPVKMKVDLIFVANLSRTLFLTPLHRAPMIFRGVVHDLDFVVVKFVVSVHDVRIADKTVVQFKSALVFRFDDRIIASVTVFALFDDFPEQSNTRAKPHVITDLD